MLYSDNGGWTAVCRPCGYNVTKKRNITRKRNIRRNIAKPSNGAGLRDENGCNVIMLWKNRNYILSWGYFFCEYVQGM